MVMTFACLGIFKLKAGPTGRISTKRLSVEAKSTSRLQLQLGRATLPRSPSRDGSSSFYAKNFLAPCPA